MHQGSQTAAWLMHGLASRMSIVLKINEEVKRARDSLDPAELSLFAIGAETRRRLAWSVYVVDSFINGEAT